MLSQLASSAVGLIGTAVLGRLGPPQLAAAGYANALYSLFFSVLLGVMSSVGARAALAHGAGDPSKLARTFRGGLAKALGLSALGLVGVLTVAACLPLFVPSGIRVDLVRPYLCLSALGLPAVLSMVALRGTLEGTGHPRTVTGVMVLGVVLMGVLAPTLAFGWGPLPRLNLVGVGAASVITNWGMALVLLVLAARHVSSSAQQLWGEVQALWRLGWPIGLALGAESGSSSLLALLMARFGPDALGAHNVVLQIVSTVFTLPLGIGITMGIRVAHAAGAGDFQRVRRTGLLGMVIAVGVMVLVVLAEVSAPRWFLGLFVDVTDPRNLALLQLAITFLAIAGVFQLLDSVIIASNIALRNLQDTFWPLLISLASYWLIGLGMGALLAFGLHLGPRGLWLGLTSGALIAAVLLSTRFLRWTGHQPPSGPGGQDLF